MQLPSTIFSRVPTFLRPRATRCRYNGASTSFLKQYHTTTPTTTTAASNDPDVHDDVDNNNNNTILSSIKRRDTLPGIQRIILIRHGESLGNVDERAYVTTADWRIPLTTRGREQARTAGRKVASNLACCSGDQQQQQQNDDDDEMITTTRMTTTTTTTTTGKVFFYVSPYLRTRQTLREILREVDHECIVGIREDPRIAEQQFGNFQSHNLIQDNKAQRSDFGRFFYRFPDGGESGFDVYNRVSGFIGTMQRDSYDVLNGWSQTNNDGSSSSSSGGASSSLSSCSKEEEDEEGMTICVITHGLAMRLFLMRWFQYTVHEFERSYNPTNGRVVVLEPASGGGGFELSEADRIAMGLPLYGEQERFRLMDDHDLLDESDW